MSYFENTTDYDYPSKQPLQQLWAYKKLLGTKCSSLWHHEEDDIMLLEEISIKDAKLTRNNSQTLIQ